MRDGGFYTMKITKKFSGKDLQKIKESNTQIWVEGISFVGRWKETKSLVFNKSDVFICISEYYIKELAKAI